LIRRIRSMASNSKQPLDGDECGPWGNPFEEAPHLLTRYQSGEDTKERLIELFDQREKGVDILEKLHTGKIDVHEAKRLIHDLIRTIPSS
ncbi:MAG: hypothetical protein NTY66_02165, partial [Candidatus Vogelbacteria bacterium]|nr:hypothetical protein [Candidatus Vogelbacteria bacterium]